MIECTCGSFVPCVFHADTTETLRAEVERLQRTSEYWKAEHLAGNNEIERLRAELDAVKRDADRCFTHEALALYESSKDQPANGARVTDAMVEVGLTAFYGIDSRKYSLPSTVRKDMRAALEAVWPREPSPTAAQHRYEQLRGTVCGNEPSCGESAVVWTKDGDMQCAECGHPMVASALLAAAPAQAAPAEQAAWVPAWAWLEAFEEARRIPEMPRERGGPAHPPTWEFAVTWVYSRARELSSARDGKAEPTARPTP